MAITEVVRPRASSGPTDKAALERIINMFDAPYVTIVGHSRPVAELGRKFIWDNGSLHPHDSIHVATAVYAKCEALETCEGGTDSPKRGLLKLNGKCDGLEIRHPKFVGQTLIEKPKDEEAPAS